MKNLKKIVSLILVVAVLMGLSVSMVGATSFTDDSSIQYSEAVELMTLIGVIDGYTDGSFRPTNDVTRAQMAKMVTYIIAGGEDVGSLYEGANTFSDCTTHWAKGYIAYANKTGIIAGVGNGKFNPDGSVTGTQAAKMLLCALGYNADYEGYTGTDWTVNVLADANAAGLLDDLSGVDMSAALSREAAAQMMYNALQCDMVEYTNGGMTITTPDGTTVVTGNSDATTVANKSPDYCGNDDEVMQLCEKYFSDLSLDVSYDSFGRPANIWDYDGDSITCAQAADYTYTGVVEGSDLYSDIGSTTMNKIDDYEDADEHDAFVYTEDGVAVDVEDGNGSVTSTNAGVAVPDLQNLSKSDDTDYFGAGMLTEIYIDTDTKTVDVVMINTYLAQITDIDDDDADDLVLTVESLSGTVDFAALSEEDSGLNLSSFSEDDYVLVTAAGATDGTDGDIATIVAAESLNGEMTAYKSGSTVTMGGTTYTLSCVFDDYDSMIGDGSDADFDSTYTLFLDAYGNAIGAVLYDESESSSANYLYVSDSVSEPYSALSGEAYVKAAATFTDGTSGVIYLYVKDSTDSDATYYLNDGTGTYHTVTDTTGVEDTAPVTAGWYSYTVNSSGQYRLTTVASTSEGNKAFQVGKSEYTEYTGTAKIPYADGKSLTATSSSKLYLVDSGTSYTGYKNFPDYTDLDLDENAEILYVKTSKTSSTLSAMYIYGESGVKETATVAYLVGLSGSDSNGDLYEFYVDGVSVEYYVDTENDLDGATDGDLVALDIDDDSAIVKKLDGYANNIDGYNYYAYSGKIYNVEDTYFTLYSGDNEDTEKIFYLENDDEDIYAEIYNVENGISSDTLSKKDEITFAYVKIGNDRYVVAAFITD